MIIGHLPAGFLCTKLLQKSLKHRIFKEKSVLFWGIIGSIAPDFDMFYFHLIDNRQHHHHTYWPHFPIVWITLFLISLILFYTAGKKRGTAAFMIFSINGIVHLLLDSIVGDVWWFMPFINKSYALFTVPARFHPWWLNFILHWSFGIELLIVTGAAALLIRSFKGKEELL